jgi:hypothetical protein
MIFGSANRGGSWLAAVVLGPWLRGTGRLVIEDGIVAIEPNGPLRLVSRVQRLEKDSGQVSVTRYWLRPPWASCVVELGEWARAGVSEFSSRTVVSHLRNAGFEVRSQRRLILHRPGEPLLGEVKRLVL